MVCVLDLLPSTRFVPRRSPTPQALLSLGLSKPRASGLKQARQPELKQGIPQRGGDTHQVGTRAPQPQLPLPLPTSPSPQVGRPQRSLHKAPAPARAPPAAVLRRTPDRAALFLRQPRGTSRFPSEAAPGRSLRCYAVGSSCFSGARACARVCGVLAL